MASSSLIPQTNLTVAFVDSEELQDDGPCCPPTPGTNAIDGNPATFWHTQWISTQPPHPHEIQLNLGGTYNVSGFRHLPRQDDVPNGRIGQWEFYVGMVGDGSD